MALLFEWDTKKAQINFQKHGVSFDEASTVFNDPLAVIFADEKHSDIESREILIGYSVLGRLLMVCFTESSPNQIRIFSARRTTGREQKNHEEYIQG